MGWTRTTHADDPIVKRMLSDAITDTLERYVIDQKLRRTDVQYWYEKIGRLCDIPDLVPITSVERYWFELVRLYQLKNTIRDRLRGEYGIQMDVYEGNPTEQSMSAHQQTLAITEPGKVMPKDILELMLKENKTALGLAAAIDGAITVSTMGQEDLAAVKVEDIATELENRKDARILYAFSNFPPAYDMNDVQPFIILSTDSGDPLLVAFVEGTFDNYRNEKSNHSTQFNFAANYLRSKVQDIWETVEQDLDKLSKALDKPSFHTDMTGQLAGAGSIIMLFSNGHVIRYFQQSAKQLFGDWGWCSNHHGHGGKKIEPVIKVPDKKPSLFSDKKTVLTGTAPPPEVKTPPPPPTDKPSEEPVNLPEGITYDGSAKKFFAQCPDRIKGKNPRRDWYEAKAGLTPSNYKEFPGPKVEITGMHVAKYSTGLGATAEKLPEGVHLIKDTTIHNKEVAEKNLPVTAERLPIVSAEMKEKFKNYLESGMVKGMIEKQGISDPAAFQDFEDKYPTFTDLTGVPLEQTFRYPFEVRRMIAKEYPEIAAILQMNTVAAYARLLNEMEKATSPDVKKEETPPAIVKKPNLFASRGSTIVGEPRKAM